MALPSIETTKTPAFGSFENLSGRMLDANPATHQVAVFICVPGTGCGSKPHCDPALTVIEPDGTWTTDITTGGEKVCRAPPQSEHAAGFQLKEAGGSG